MILDAILEVSRVIPRLPAQVKDMNDPLLARMLHEDLIIPLAAIACGTIIAVVAITFSILRTILVSRAREQSRRELAAYVAEGTLDPDKAAALLEAGKSCWEKGPPKQA